MKNPMWEPGDKVRLESGTPATVMAALGGGFAGVKLANGRTLTVKENALKAEPPSEAWLRKNVLYVDPGESQRTGRLVGWMHGNRPWEIHS